MPKGTNQKLKLFYLAKILLERTDEKHGITMPELLEALEKYEVSAERKSIYNDIETLRDIGIEIDGIQRGKTFYYHVVSREFELAELKLLVDAIQSSKFITEKKSRELIKKLEGQASMYEARQLQRQVYVAGRIKTMNESIYYNVDAIHTAIDDDKKISFLYFQWNVKKEMEMKRNGQPYEISPWALTWDDENYYLVGYDSNEDKVKHFRVDKMKKISATEETREGKELFKNFDIASYTKKNFGMFAGEEQAVKVQFHKRLVGVVIDRFGKDVIMVPVGEDHFNVTLNIAVSDQFLGWVFALGDEAKILGPENVCQRMKAMAQRIAERY